MEKKIKVVIFGLGTEGKAHVEAFQKSPFVEQVYGSEPDPDFCKKRCGELGITPISLDEVMADPSIRLCSIAAPNQFHLPLAERSMKAGKAVLCEKPMGMDLTEARRMLEIYHSIPGAFLQIGFELHYSKLYMIAKKWIDDGLIGEVRDIQTRYFCPEFHRKNTWRSNTVSPAFLIGEKLSHYLDLQRWYMGAEPEKVYSICAPNVVNYFHHPDNHNIMTRFANGGVGVLTFLMNAPALEIAADTFQQLDQIKPHTGHYLQYFIVGTKGALETDIYRRTVQRWEYTDTPERLASNVVEIQSFELKDSHYWIHNSTDEAIRVSELVAKGLKPDYSPDDAFQSTKFCYAAERSIVEDKIIEFSSL